MKTNIIVLFLLVLRCFAISPAVAQQTMFTKVYFDNFIGAQGYSIAKAADGGYIIAGERKGHPMVMKTGTEGDILWMKNDTNLQFGRFISICNTFDNAYLVAGITGDPVAGGDDLICRKIAENGDTIFTRQYHFPQSATILSVQETTDHGFAFCGSLAGGASMKIFILKTDASGVVQWEKFLQPAATYCEAYSVRPANDGGYLVLGKINVTTPNYQSSAILMKLTSSGDVSWSKKLNIPSSQYMIGYDVLETSGGLVLLLHDEFEHLMLVQADNSGNPVSGVEFQLFVPGSQQGLPGPRLRKTSDGGYVFITTGWGYGDYLVKFDSTLTYQWSSMMQIITSDVIEAPDHGLMVLGNGPIMGVSMSPSLQPQIGVIKTDSLGNSVACVVPGWINTNPVTITAASYSFSVTGGITPVASHPAISDATLTTTESCVAYTGEVNETDPDEGKIVIIPNPASDFIEISASFKAGVNGSRVEILDPTGKIVCSDELRGPLPFHLSVAELPEGLYLVRVISADEFRTAKILISR
jgi:hypothetical protein